MRALVTLALTVGLPALGEPAVLLQPAVGTPAQVTLSGRVLKNAPRPGGSVVGTNLRRLTSSEWEGATVEVFFGGQEATTTSGHDGEFSVTLRAPAGAGFAPGLSGAGAHVRGASAAATVQVLPPEAPFLLVSDFDDTVAVTRVLDPLAALETVLARDADSQGVVPGMAALYRCLRDWAERAPGFMLVSGSPRQYLPRVQAFLARHGFPVFGIALRNLGPSTLSGYKQPVLRALLSEVPNPVVFVGDSGEKDPEIYAQLRDEFPGRVRAIYIRDVGRAEDPRRFQGMVLFTQPAQVLADAVARGLVRPGCPEEVP